MRAARADANQAVIVAALREIGCSVQPLHTVGQGVPDLLVGMAGKNLLIEVKDGSKKPSDQKLTPDQMAWHKNWRGQVETVNSIEQAIIALRSHINGR